MTTFGELPADAHKIQAAEISDQDSLDDRDKTILTMRTAAFHHTEGPCVGDYIDFTNGVTHRIAYIWPEGVQTSDDGSFYLGNSGMSCYGSLYTPMPTETLTLAKGMRDASAWFFHHDHWTAHNAIHVRVLARVWASSAKTPKRQSRKAKR
jgi:hypothetical protein